MSASGLKHIIDGDTTACDSATTGDLTAEEWQQSDCHACLYRLSERWEAEGTAIMRRVAAARDLPIMRVPGCRLAAVKALDEAEKLLAQAERIGDHLSELQAQQAEADERARASGGLN